MIYGIRYNTESHTNDMGLQRFTSRAAAIAWRDKEGPGGVGQPFSRENGHRYVRTIYELHGRLPTGSRLIQLMDQGRCSSAAAKANWVTSKGSLVE